MGGHKRVVPPELPRPGHARYAARFDSSHVARLERGYRSLHGDGMITTVTDGGGTALKLRVQGLDLGRLSGSANVTIAVMPRSATAAVTVQGSRKSRRLH